MEVPCCAGLSYIAKMAIEASGRNIPAKDATVSLGGCLLGEKGL